MTPKKKGSKPQSGIVESPQTTKTPQRGNFS